MYWTKYVNVDPARANHAVIVFGLKIYTFGGFSRDDLRQRQPYVTGEQFREFTPMEVCVLDSDVQPYRWMTLPTPDPNDPQYTINTPFHRAGHTAVEYSGKAILWGGRNGPHRCNKLHTFDLSSNRWAYHFANGPIPKNRDGHSACIINENMFVFGGYEAVTNCFSQDLTILNCQTLTWSTVITRGLPPERRDLHTATAIGRHIYIFGGRGGRQTNEIYYNNIMIYDTVTNTWYEPTTFGNKPAGRRSHAAFVCDGQLYIFGGFNGSIYMYYDNLMRYDPGSYTWSEVTVQGAGPSPRRAHRCGIIDNRVFLFGGASSDSNLSFVPTPLDRDFLIYHNDLYVLNLDNVSSTLRTLQSEVTVRQSGRNLRFADRAIQISLNNDASSESLPQNIVAITQQIPDNERNDARIRENEFYNQERERGSLENTVPGQVSQELTPDDERIFRQQLEPVYIPEEPYHDSSESDTADDAEGKCTLCLRRPISVIILPCAHVYYCYRCAKRLYKTKKPCPACRIPIETFKKVFLP